MTKYYEYRAKARKWDKLMEFIGNENHITDTLQMNDGRILRMSKDHYRIQRVEKKKTLIGLDILGE